jgi:hypothetical protein
MLRMRSRAVSKDEGYLHPETRARGALLRMRAVGLAGRATARAV